MLEIILQKFTVIVKSVNNARKAVCKMLQSFKHLKPTLQVYLFVCLFHAYLFLVLRLVRVLHITLKFALVINLPIDNSTLLKDAV